MRSIFGWNFGTLIFCDEAWALARVAGSSDEDERLWRAAWGSLVMRHQAHDKLLKVLEPSYRRRWSRSAPRSPRSASTIPTRPWSRTWCCTTFRARSTSATLVARFVLRESMAERRAQVISILGTSMKALSPLGEEGEARLRALAERRLEAVEVGADADELAGFAWWFSSGEFDTDWSLDFLRRALQAGCHPHPDHVVAERLADLRGHNVVERMEVLRLMVEVGARDWFVLGSREKIEGFCARGLPGRERPLAGTRLGQHACRPVETSTLPICLREARCSIVRGRSTSLSLCARRSARRSAAWRWDHHLVRWPVWVSAWTVILASEQLESAARAAVENPSEASAGGLRLGVLRSSDYASLRSCYWVAFAGQFTSSAEALEAAERSEANQTGQLSTGFSKKSTSVRAASLRSGSLPG